MGNTYKWARRVKRGEPYYEVSTKGDQRWSPLCVKTKYGLTIEQTRDSIPNCSYEEYLQLWVEYADNNPKLIEELKVRCKDVRITDMFATSDNNQAKALCDILNGDT